MQESNEGLAGTKPLVVAVVGPTNEGKTSLLRTLTNDPDFGHVNAFTGTTVRAEVQKVFYRGVVEILQLIDTPGFQTSSEILELVLDASSSRGGAYELSDILAAIPLDDEDFRHDLRAWREIERCDVVIFVANVAEDPKKSLLKNTLELLRHIGKPTLVAYNNLGNGPGDEGAQLSATGTPENYQSAWDETLRRNSFFLVQRYDAHRRSFLDEVDLFEKLVALAREPQTQRALRLEIAERQARERRRLGDSRRLLADALVDVVAFRLIETNVEPDNWQSRQRELEASLRERVLQREHRAQSAILETWGFKLGSLARETLVVEDESLETDDLFDHDVKKSGAVGVGVGAAIGAIADIASAGLSFGTGLTIGAFLGGLLGGGGVMAYNSKYDRKRKRLSTRVQPRVVAAFLARGVDLIHKLEQRGKAVDDAMQTTVSAQPKSIEVPNVTRMLEACSRFPGYSRLNVDKSTLGAFDLDWRAPLAWLSGEERKPREEVVTALAEELRRVLPDDEERRGGTHGGM